MSKKLPTANEAGTFVIAAIILSHAVWSVTFFYGAFEKVSYSHLLMIWVASFAVLLAIPFAYKNQEGEKLFSPISIIILLMPTCWFALEILAYYNKSADAYNTIRTGLTLVTICLSLPYILYMVLQSALPEIAEIHHPKLWFGLCLIALIIAAAGYYAGSYNYYFMTCEDFDGSKPKNCWPVNP